MPRVRWIPALLAALSLLAMMSAACGDDDDDDDDGEVEPPEPTEIETEEAPQPATEITIIVLDLGGPAGPPADNGIGRFDQEELLVVAGAEIAVTVDNQDAAIFHNFAVYPDEASAPQPGAPASEFEQALAGSELEQGPVTQQVTFTAPAAGETLFFQCDAHQTWMVGTIRAQ